MTTTPTTAASPHLVEPIARPSSAPPGGVRSETPPVSGSRAVPKDFRSSLSAWWSTSSYKEARAAEERLLRRMAMFEPAPPAVEQGGVRGWLGFTGSTDKTHHGPASDPAAVADVTSNAPGEAATQAVQMSQTGLVATIRNVFVPSPNPADAPQHPADPRDPSITPAASAASSSSSLSTDSQGHKGKHVAHCKGKKDGKLVDYINTLEITSPENKNSKEAVVVLHGYAAALGFFFRNWEPVAQSAAATSRRTFFLDWLGMGLSSRPSPSLLHTPSSAPIPSRVARAEHFFLSSLESWRASVGVEKMVLVGHSLGGYLASAYAVRYPERVSGLILVSPAGIPHGPEYVKYPLTSELTEKDRQELKRLNSARSERETPQELDEATDAAEAELSGGGQVKHQAKGEAKDWEKRRQESVVRRGMMKFFVWGWEKGLSPFSILRSVGPWGPLWVGKYSSRRFASQSEEDIRDLHSYIYGTSIMKGSGEYCISHILAPGAYARVPILDRIARLKVPVTFMYGDNDWMDVEGGRASVEQLRKAGNTKGSVHVVPKAGHHLYLDNPSVTNRLLDEAIKAVPKFANATAASA